MDVAHAPAPAEVDSGTLGWLLPEVTAAFDAASVALRAFRAGAAGVERRDVDFAPLRVARSHLHQAHGAMQVVELAGVPRVTEAIEALVATFESAPERCDATSLDAIATACRSLVEYLEELRNGAPVQPLHLFPSYRDLLVARGVERIHASDLFHADLAVRPALVAGRLLDARGLAEQRALFEHALLRYMRNEADTGALDVLSQATGAIEASVAASSKQNQPRAFWWAARAFFEAAANDGLAATGVKPADVKRLAGRINLQIRQLAEGAPTIAERLFLDTLFVVAASAPVTPRVRDVQVAYGLEGAIPKDYERQRYGLVDTAALSRACALLGDAKSAWIAVVGGDIEQIKGFALLAGSLIDAVAPFKRRGLVDVAQIVGGIATDLCFDPRRPAPNVGLDVATALLFLDGALEHARALDDEFDRRAATVVARVEAAAVGSEPPSEPVEWLDRLSREAAERLTMATFVDELQANLRQAEKILDAFFRDTNDRAGLDAAITALKQVSGALALLGHADAHQAIDVSREAIERFRADPTTGDTASFQRIADNLGAAGFYVEQLRRDRVDHGAFHFDAEEGIFTADMARAHVPTTPPATLDAPELVLDFGDRTAEAEAPTAEAPTDDEDAVEAELLEIFLDEAQMVLADASDPLRLLDADPANTTALAVLRRGFHTLKGSSRMVGLASFGDAAWAVEETLNAFLAGQVAASTDLRSLVDYASRYLGDWVEELRTSSRSAREPDALIEAARAVRDGATPALPPRPVAVKTPAPAAPVAHSVPAPTVPTLRQPQPAPVEEAEDDFEKTLFMPREAVELDPRFAATQFLGAGDRDDALLDIEFFGEQPKLPQRHTASLVLADLVDDDAEPIDEASTEAADDDWPSSHDGDPAFAKTEFIGGAYGAMHDEPAPFEFEPAATYQPPRAFESDPLVFDDEPAVAEPVMEVETTAEVTLPPVDAHETAESSVEPMPEPIVDVEAPEPFAEATPPETVDVAEAPRDELVEIGPLTLSTALFNIYLGEADERLAVLTSDFASWRVELDRFVSEEATRAAHSLAGSSATVGLVPVHDLAAGIEDVLQQLWRQPLLLSADRIALLQDAVETMGRMLHRFAAERMPDGDAARVDALHALRDALATEAEAVAADAADAAAPADAIGTAEPDAVTEAVEDAFTEDLRASADDAERASTEVLESLTDDAQDVFASEASSASAYDADRLLIDDETFRELAPSANDDALANDAVASSDEAPLFEEPVAEAPVPHVDAAFVEEASEEAPVSEAQSIEDHVDEEAVSFVDAQVEDAPVVETPVIEAAVADVEVAEAPEPQVEAQVDEAPAVEEAPVSEAQAMEDHVEEEAVSAVEAHVDDAPIVETPVIEAAVAEVEGADAPVAEAPEPQVEAQVDETPLVEEPSAEAPVFADEAIVEPAAFSAEPEAHDVAAERSTDAPSDATGPLPTTLAIERAVRDELDAELLDVFIAEGNEILPQISALLREWHGDTTAKEPARLLLRHLHTLKGSARMAGAMRLGEVVHDLEARVEATQTLDDVPTSVLDELMSAHDRSLELFDELGRPVEAVAVPAAADAGRAVADGDAVVDGVVDGVVESTDAPRADAGRARDGKDPRQQAVRVGSDTLDRLVNLAGEVSITRARIENEVSQVRTAVGELAENVERLRGQLREIELQAEFQMQSRLQSQSTARESEKFDPLEFDRFTRFQELTRMMAESVNDVKTLQQNLQKNLETADIDLSSQRRMTRDLQQDLMRVRMVPFANVSERLYRVARRAAKEVDKRVNLDIRGGSVEIDRSVLERMAGSFEHLLRNHIVHGVETRAARRDAGKSETGELLVEVRQEGSEIVLTFSDDGAGIDHDRIRAKARTLGLIGDDETPSDAAAAEYIFHPGFSTADEVTELAGRGIGMDVVRSDASALGGRVAVDSERGRGTRFTITLPLTLAITQVVLVSVSQRLFALPAVLVEEVRQLRPQSLAEAYRAGHVDRAGDPVRIAFLGALLEIEQSVPIAQRTSPVLMLRSANESLAVHVDEVVANQEVVVKTLGPQLARMSGMAGATVLGSGEIVLIINPVQVAQTFALPSLEETAATAPVFELPEAATEAAMTLPTVMVVDDSLTVRRVTQRLLSREGYQVVLAKDGVDAIERLQEHTPDVMLVDIEMPRMDGFDLTRHVRADERLKDIPIVMITSRTANKHRDHALTLGVDEYLGKPYQEEELLELLATLVKSGRPQAA